MAGVIRGMNRANPASPRALRPRQPHLRIAAFGLLLLSTIPGLRSAAEVARDFDVPSGQARDTLKRFAAQAQVEIVFPSENTLGVATNAVRGRLAPEEAIGALLAGTNLIATRDPKTGAYSVRPRLSDPNGSRAAQDNPNRRPNAPIVANPRSEAPVSDIVELSPFTVSTTQDTGYAAQETLAGTRMRTSLKNVASSMSIITPEMIRDLAVSSPEQALLFTPSVDTYQGDTNAPEPSNFRFGTGQPYSIRGFGNYTQSASTDFFTTFPRLDFYNSERLTLQRGPNALLFGVGGPAGVAVTTTKRAQPARTKTEVQVQTDRWSSKRVSLDHNQVVVPNQLALRLNALEGWKKEYRINEGVRQHRVTGGVTWQPTKNTSVVLNHENYSIHMNYVALTPFFEAGIMQWNAKGRPTVEFPSQGLTWAASGHPQSSFDPRTAIGQNAGYTQTYVTGLDLPNPMVNQRLQGLMNSTNAFGGISGQTFQAKDPWAAYGLSRDTNYESGTWDEPSDRLHGRWTQLFVEQKILTGLYLELAGNLARQDRIYAVDSFRTLRIDMNRYLPDGRLNPGYLVPYASIPTTTRVRDDLAEEYRATLSYEADLSRIHRWLGRQNFGLLGQSTRTTNKQDSFRVINLATIGRSPYPADPVGSAITPYAYFPNGRYTYPLPSNFEIAKQLPVLNQGLSLVGATAADRAPVNLAFRPGAPAARNKVTDDAMSFGWQGRWFKDRLVTVFGLRTDDAKNYIAPPTKTTIDPAVPGGVTDPLQRFYDLAKDLNFNSVPNVAARGTARTYGAVYHALSWLSLTYNLSRNFSPTTSSQLNFQGAAAPNSSGETKDYGVRVYALGGRLSVGANYFINTAANQAFSAFGPAPLSSITVIMRQLRGNYRNQGDSHFTAMAPDGGYLVDTTSVSDTRSFTAKGYELSVVFNPSGNWRISLSGSSNENSMSESFESLRKYFYTDNQPFQGIPTWQNYVAELRKVASGVRSNQFDLDPASASARQQATTDAQTIETQANALDKSFWDLQALVGSTTNRNGKYALNGVAAYSFSNSGTFKGWSLGGNFRWRSAPTIGYARKVDAAGTHGGVIDASQPMLGDEYFEFGTMLAYQRRLWSGTNLRLQLNIDNPFDWSQPRLVFADYDTQALLGPKDAVQPLRWELRRPRNYTLSATFSF